MPTYKNTTTQVISVKGIRMEAGQIVETLQVIESLPTGVIELLATPVYSPTAYSAELKGGSGDSGSISIPAGLEQFKFTVACGAGVVKVQFDGNTAHELVVVAGERKDIQFLNRIVKAFKVYYLETGSICEVSIA